MREKRRRREGQMCGGWMMVLFLPQIKKKNPRNRRDILAFTGGREESRTPVSLR